jgi:hypothetical protein
MIRHDTRLLGMVLLVVLLSFTVQAGPFRSIGVRVIVPLGGLPVILGLEATANIGSAVGSLSFFLSVRGDALLLGSLDLPLDSSTLGTCIRVTAGLYDFDPQPALPSLVGGGGISTYGTPLGWFGYSLAGEFLYPLAFPLPMFSIGGGWVSP